MADFKETFEPSDAADGDGRSTDGEPLAEAESDKTLETE